jgi:DNA-binding NarL/FixJ family response regulator
MSVRVAIVEDNAHYRTGLHAVVSTEPDFAVSGVFSSAAPLIDAAETAAASGRPRPWDVVLMDIGLPGLSGIEATRRLKQLYPDVPVVTLTVFDEPSTILEAICAGADGYLLKKTSMAELIGLVRAVLAGGSSLTPTVARTLLELTRRSTSTPSSSSAAAARLDLSEREHELLRCLVQGLSYKQAADAMDVSIGTVRTYIRRMYGKLQVHSMAEAITRALRDGLV